MFFFVCRMHNHLRDKIIFSLRFLVQQLHVRKKKKQKLYEKLIQIAEYCSRKSIHFIRINNLCVLSNNRQYDDESRAILTKIFFNSDKKLTTGFRTSWTSSVGISRFSFEYEKITINENFQCYRNERTIKLPTIRWIAKSDRWPLNFKQLR